MSDVILKMQIPATATGSKGTSDIREVAYSPIFAETNGTPSGDPFFRVSPAVAVGDGYMSEVSDIALLKK